MADLLHEEALDVLRRIGVPAGARVLLVEPNPGPHEDTARPSGFRIERGPDPESLPSAQRVYDAAVVVGVLERSEWDRWILQQVARALKSDAPMVVRVPNLWSFATPADVLRLTKRFVDEALRRVRRWGGEPAPGAIDAPARRFRGRAYARARLVGLLERLGFEIVEIVPQDRGSDWLAVARKRDRGILGGAVPLLACSEHRAAFERERAGYMTDREQWAVENSLDPRGARQTLEPREFSGRAVLVLAPHPDDEIIGCGGTLLRLVRAGARVVCVQATDGSAGWALRHAPEDVRRTVRLGEARAVAQAAGFARLDAWGADNRAFRADEDLMARLARLLVELEPRFVFSPLLTDAHEDHRTLNRILAGGIERARDAAADMQVLGYEAWSLAVPDLVCDVTEMCEEQEELLLRYPTAIKVDDYLEMCERRNYYNACVYLGRPGYAEVFQVVAGREFPDLAARSPASLTRNLRRRT